ncbi:MAG: tRNA uridine(34) 5-carboxymethylaminomethyl modification radical SAM/GNAT enzyme Elp3 [Coriobacteriales bacterium]|jgi:elongator complex protein 3|nr:tRNA uridine(34) 5-carboxymethylaminomethyl modification radical SAM/GNAT enzyme Elp3 [Coriobacteriales bacterium]
METVLLEILTELRENGRLNDGLLAKIIRKHNKNLVGNRRHVSKKRLLPYYFRIKDSDPERWAQWGVTLAMEEQLLRILQAKPRRTASGVATITVITRPQGCTSDCLYCPNDVRMPKSYLSDEPACQRAERNYFDPYLQVVSRLRTLTHMGHATDKIELIVLGGTWNDYPIGYRVWFIAELFRALNDGTAAEQNAKERRKIYCEKGLSSRADTLAQHVAKYQQQVNEGLLTYNQAIERLYGKGSVWEHIAHRQTADFNMLVRQHILNETSQHRVVGLVIETRPDTITAESLTLIRRLGCTKVQIGIQSLNPAILNLNNRNISVDRIRRAFELLRVFGFKIQTHFMLNLYGSSPEEDESDYRRLVTKPAYLPDEVKLYPCALVDGTGLCVRYAEGTWQPYGEEELIDLLVKDTLATPEFVRISRMVRDISARDILVGNKKTNLRQLVEGRIEERGALIEEMRYREIGTRKVDVNSLALESLIYETTTTEEHFIQWVTPARQLAGFLRLSLPKLSYVREHQSILPIGLREAMIREVHVYGAVAQLHKTGEGVQHLGLGRRLIEVACETARDQGYEKINVISSVGVREYYRSLGFMDAGLYQQMSLTGSLLC